MHSVAGCRAHRSSEPVRISVGCTPSSCRNRALEILGFAGGECARGEPQKLVRRDPSRGGSTWSDHGLAGRGSALFRAGEGPKERASCSAIVARTRRITALRRVRPLCGSPGGCRESTPTVVERRPAPKPLTPEL